MGRRRRKWSWALVLVALPTLILGGIAWHDTSTLTLTRTSTTSAKLRADLRIVHITDLHDWHTTGDTETVSWFIRQTRPHLIAVTGDLINTDTTDLSNVRRWLTALVATGVPVVAVDGNHDHWNEPQLPALHRLYTETGVRWLVGGGFALDGEYGKVDVLGTDDYFSGHGNLPTALRAARPETFRLLLTHSPEVRDALRGSDVDVTLCGHTHGGQVQVPGIGSLYVPGQGFLPQYGDGWYDLAGTKLYVNHGLGTTAIPLRLFAPAHVVLVTVKPV